MPATVFHKEGIEYREKGCEKNPLRQAELRFELNPTMCLQHWLSPSWL